MILHGSLLATISQLYLANQLINQTGEGRWIWRLIDWLNLIFFFWHWSTLMLFDCFSFFQVFAEVFPLAQLFCKIFLPLFFTFSSPLSWEGFSFQLLFFNFFFSPKLTFPHFFLNFFLTFLSLFFFSTFLDYFLSTSLHFFSTFYFILFAYVII